MRKIMRMFTCSNPILQYGAFLILLMCLIDCGSSVDTEAVGQEEQRILNGNATYFGAEAERGIANVYHMSNNYHCTGVLLRNDTIITARHCVTLDESSGGTLDTNPSDYWLLMDGQKVQAAEILDNASGGPAYDFAYIIVTPFFMTGGPPPANVAQGWLRPVYALSDSSLVGSTLDCEGEGYNTLSGGGSDLRTANLLVSSATDTTVTYTPNGSGQIQYFGDSGSTCFTSAGAMTSILSLCNVPGPPGNIAAPTSCVGTSPQVIAPDVNYRFWNAPGATIDTSSSSNVWGDSMILNDARANGNPYAGVWVTPNFNPPGQPANWLNKNLGVWYDGSQWLIFNEDGTQMPTGMSFNVAVGTNSLVSGAHVAFDSMQMGFGDPNLITIVTQSWSPNGACGCICNNDPVGVWFDGSQWWIYRENQTQMPAGAAFNVHVCDPNDGCYIHHATTSNTQSDYTILDNQNLNNQPGAKVIVTHNWSASPVVDNHPVGVYYTGSNWAIFNEDLAAMPTNIAFNVWILP